VKHCGGGDGGMPAEPIVPFSLKHCIIASTNTVHATPLLGAHPHATLTAMGNWGFVAKLKLGGSVGNEIHF